MTIPTSSQLKKTKRFLTTSATKNLSNPWRKCKIPSRWPSKAGIRRRQFSTRSLSSSSTNSRTRRRSSTRAKLLTKVCSEVSTAATETVSLEERKPSKRSTRWRKNLSRKERSKKINTVSIVKSWPSRLKSSRRETTSLSWSTSWTREITRRR